MPEMVKIGIANSEIAHLMREIKREVAGGQREVLRIIRKYTPLILEEARRLVPVDKGTLRDTIRMEIDENDLVGVVMAGGTPETFYAAFVELGTRNTNGSRFLLRAFLRYQNDIIRDLERLVK